jgi:uncharacterized protein YggE
VRHYKGKIRTINHAAKINKLDTEEKGGKKMNKKSLLLIVSLIAALAVVGLVGCTAEGTELEDLKGLNLGNQQQGIWVTGTGKVSAVPDIVELRLGIEAQETTVAAAQTEATDAMDEVMAALLANGVAEKDIQTQYFSIQRVTRWDSDTQQEVVIGYRVTNMVTARIRNVDKAGAVIDAVAVAGGDFIRIDSINFSIDDPSVYYDEAREEAMADATDKAERLADLAGVTLGKPTFISESVQAPPTVQRYFGYEEAVVAAKETPISPGELEVSLTVQLTYAILD